MKTKEKEKSTALATKPKVETGIVDWNAELKRQAEAAAKQEAAAGGGQFFSLKAGQLSFGGAVLPGNQMAVIIIDHISENTYYDKPYDADQPGTPICYAFGRDDETITPHDDVSEPQHDAYDAETEKGGCMRCPLNQWGSADMGRGKKCKNRRRLACVSAGTLDKDGDLVELVDAKQVADSTCGFLGLPPTAINGWAKYVKNLANVLGRPPRGVITKVTVVPDAKTQFRVEFTPMGSVPDELMGAVMVRVKEVAGQIEMPYQAPAETAAPAKPAAKVGAKKKY